MDPYIQQTGVLSIMAVPLVLHGNPIGIIYLENKSTPGCFTHDRVQVIKLVCTQAALSLANARLYASLEQKVHARTKDAEQKMFQLETVNRERGREIAERKYGVGVLWFGACNWHSVFLFVLFFITFWYFRLFYFTHLFR